jgi:hypothetical protein
MGLAGKRLTPALPGGVLAPTFAHDPEYAIGAVFGHTVSAGDATRQAPTVKHGGPESSRAVNNSGLKKDRIWLLV